MYCKSREGVFCATPDGWEKVCIDLIIRDETRLVKTITTGLAKQLARYRRHYGDPIKPQDREICLRVKAGSVAKLDTYVTEGGS